MPGRALSSRSGRHEKPSGGPSAAKVCLSNQSSSSRIESPHPRIVDAMQRKLHDVFHSNVVRVSTFYGLLSVLNDCNICVSPPLLEGALAHTGIAFRCGEDGEGVALDEEKFLRLAEHLMYDPALATSFYDDDRQLVELALKGEAQRGDCHDPSLSAPKSLFESLPDFERLLAPFHLSANRLCGSGEAADFDFHGFWKSVCQGETRAVSLANHVKPHQPAAADEDATKMLWDALPPDLRQMLAKDVFGNDTDSEDSKRTSARSLISLSVFDELQQDPRLSRLLSHVNVRKSFYHTLDYSKAPRDDASGDDGNTSGNEESQCGFDSLEPESRPGRKSAGRRASVAFVCAPEILDEVTPAPEAAIEQAAEQCEQVLGEAPAVMSEDEYRQWERRNEKQEQAQQQLLTRYQSAYQSFSQRRRTTRLASLSSGLDPNFVQEMSLLGKSSGEAELSLSLPDELSRRIIEDETESSTTSIVSSDETRMGGSLDSCRPAQMTTKLQNVTERQPPLRNLSVIRPSSSAASVSTPQTGRSAVTGRSFARSFRVKVREFQLNDDEKRMLQCKRVQSATLEREVQFLDYDVLRHVGGSAARRVMSMKREMCGGSASPSRLPSAPRSTPSYSAPMSRCSSAKSTSISDATLSRAGRFGIIPPRLVPVPRPRSAQSPISPCPHCSADSRSTCSPSPQWERWMSGGKRL